MAPDNGENEEIAKSLNGEQAEGDAKKLRLAFDKGVWHAVEKLNYKFKLRTGEAPLGEGDYERLVRGDQRSKLDQ